MSTEYKGLVSDTVEDNFRAPNSACSMHNSSTFADTHVVHPSKSQLNALKKRTSHIVHLAD